ncbi:MAG: putative WD repeat protein Prp5, partial [Streblomastix strix]
MWDLRTGRILDELTYHKKGVKSLVNNPFEFTFASGGADNVKKYAFSQNKYQIEDSNEMKAEKEGQNSVIQNQFGQSLVGTQYLGNIDNCGETVNSLSLNEDGVLAGGCKDGSLCFWDYRTGYLFEKINDITQQVGTQDFEKCINACSFDRSGTRLITANSDKSIKIFIEDEKSTPKTNPIEWTPKNDIRRW